MPPGSSASTDSLSTLPPRQRGLPVIVALGCLIALVGLVLMVISGLAYRTSLWSLGVAFRILAVGAWTALVGGVLSLGAAILTRPGTQRRGFIVALVGVIIGLGGFGYVAALRVRASQVPPIHDITTDVTNPPTFSAILPLRAGAPDSAGYGGPAVAALQRAAYPDIAPAELPIPPGSTFRVALAAARNMGWEIVAADSTGGRIEATATTRWFGFKDDIVVRITPTERGSRVDVRSVSRVGRSDLGTNARRVRRYVAALERSV